jgi:PIN domain nuclease of toxin-antitoxin system
MRLLLDTHAFLWFVFGDPKLPTRSRSLIEDQSNQVSLSLASVWEMTIKHTIGKLPLTRQIEEFVTDGTSTNNIQVESIRLDHVFRLLNLPTGHKDPFDRLIAAQCLVEEFNLISADEAFDGLGVTRIWQ